MTAAPGDAAVSPPAVRAPEPERVMLERLCAPAFAHAATAGSVSAVDSADAGAAAVDVLARIDAHPRYVPRRPQLLPQLTRAINDPAASAPSIAAIIAQDPALAGNLLRIANSAMYRRQDAPIEHLERAVALLGTEGLRRIVMAALLQPVIADDGSVFGRCAALLWDHTLRSADFALRADQGATRDDQHAAQLLALLYGLGGVVVVQVLRDTWGRRGDGVPEVGTLAMLLDAWSARCARSISVDWGLSSRVGRVLEELAGEDGQPAPSGLARSLRIHRAQAAAAMPGAAGRESVERVEPVELPRLAAEPSRLD
ncbi:HDOD domain-containing protein [Luteimonas kalidii]|uniref:HDOD domain-containing protein n=1 Tax=Luteimonas kalidii TaxID=3042025 RepID=A0ABT6JRX3_9GAMM|nr:HDOD domain-containing protein [Luteimonas kalidii]MDH5833437.1 HDOD domain-containing protein [Luteimonas kalidii]